MRVAADASPHFYADAITEYDEKNIVARLSTGHTTDIGLRVDDGTNNNYTEIYLDAQNDGTYDVTFRTQAGQNAGPTYPCSEMVVVRLRWVTATPAVVGYTVNEDGYRNTIVNFTTGVIAWTPSRVGIVVYNNSAHWSIVDWFYSTFS